MVFLEVGKIQSSLYVNRFDPHRRGMFLVCTVWTFGDYRTGSRLQEDGCGRHVNFVWSCILTSEGPFMLLSGNVNFVP